MSKIFELFGYPISDRSKSAESNRRQAHCPFMSVPCDGGGNRYSSQIQLDSTISSQLQEYFGRNSGAVQAGVCSLQMKSHEPPWIVCPRRLLTLGKRGDEAELQYQEEVLTALFRHSGFEEGSRVGIWPELKLRYTTDDTDDTGMFDYTFDYVLMLLDRVSQSDVAAATQQSASGLKGQLGKAGYGLTRRNGVQYVDDFSVGSPVIVEVMTSSTSGGNKKKRTTIALAFEDAILGKEHKAPNINKRQIIARMVSQLIVKSQVGMSWGGKTIWVVQDHLVDYISSTTALDIHEFLADQTSEVNMLSFSYADRYTHPGEGVIQLTPEGLFAGPITPTGEEIVQASFQDIIQIGTVPPKHALLQKLASKAPTGILTIS